MKQIIVLDTSTNPTGDNSVRFAMWFPVPTVAQAAFANTAKFSVWTGASIAEVAAIKSGQVAEMVSEFQVPTTMTTAQVKLNLISYYTVTSSNFYAQSNPYKYYGFYWDGMNWSS